MTCAEREHIPILKTKMRCQDAEILDLGFAKVKPDLICNGIPVEVECVERIHIGLGQALAYKYATGRAGLVVIAEQISPDLRKFLDWCRQLGIEIYIYVNDVVIRLYKEK